MMSLRVVPEGSWVAAVVISLSVMRLLPVAPLGRKIGTYTFFFFSVGRIEGCLWE